MRPFQFAAAVLVAGFALSAAAADVTPRPSFAQPAMSPDGSRIAFVSGGAIWEVAATGGTAHLLVSDKGSDSRPLYSPDGKRLAFESDVTGGGDIYVLDLAGGQLRRITYADGSDQPSGWSHDGLWLYFSSMRDNTRGFHGVYRVRVSGGTPMPVSLETYRNEEQGAPSPDGKQVAIVGGGMGAFQWWRHGHAHIDEGAIWLLNNDGSHSYRRLTPDDARADWPMWAVDGKSLYYMSDRSGVENIWHVQADGSESALTHFGKGRVLWPTISADGRRIAFERDFRIWTIDVVDGRARAVSITLGGAVAAPHPEHEAKSKGFRAMALSPDGKKLALLIQGDVYAVDAKKGGKAQRVTHTPGAEYDLVWAPDSRRLVYGSEGESGSHLFVYDFADATQKQLTHGDGEDRAAVFSPDGKSLAFVRNGNSLQVLDMANGRLHQLVKAHIDFRRPLGSDRPLTWSPDGRYVAYLAFGKRMFRNAYAVKVEDGKVTPLSVLGNTFSGDISFSPDGRTLMFVSGQRTEPGRVASIDLIARTPEFRENKFQDLFKPSTQERSSGEGKHDRHKTGKADAKKKVEPVRIDAAGIRERLSLLPIGLDVNSIAISPDGKTLLIAARVAGRTNLYAWSLDRLSDKPPVARQLTSTPGPKGDVQFSPDGKHVFYLDGGRVFTVALAPGGKAKPLKVSADVDVDFARDKMVAFHEAWTWLRNNFHDPHMHGVDWDAVRTEYAPLIAGAPTPESVNRLMNLMVGELNASHSGVRLHHQDKPVTGRLGLMFDPAVYERDGRFRVSRVVPLSPAAVSAKIEPGDVLLAVDGRQLGGHTNLAGVLAHRIGSKTVLRIAHGSRKFDVAVKPVDSGTLGNLVYEAWANANRAYVNRISGGKLGYVHLRDMSTGSLQRFYKDLDAQNATREGVVIDERNNFGGFVNAYALDVLSRRPYLYMTFRGFGKAQAARTILGQRALERPTVLITNRVTLSDGEDFSEGYRALGLGKIVGEPTAGWIIYTSNVPLIDGSVVRLPFITVTTADGKPMEGHPRPVDVPVSRPLGEAYRGKDSDLDASVRTLLQQIGQAHH